MVSPLITAERSISVALNFDSIELLRTVVGETCDVPDVSYTVSGSLGYRGLDKVTKIIRGYNNEATVILDHQKAGTSDKAIAEPFCTVASESDVNAVVLFPINDVQSQNHWVSTAQKHGLEVIMGPEVSPQSISMKRGFMEMFINEALKKGVTNIWTRGDPGRVHNCQEILSSAGPLHEYTLFLSHIAKPWDGSIHRLKIDGKAVAVVGRAIYEAGGPSDIRQRAQSIAARFAGMTAANGYI